MQTATRSLINHAALEVQLTESESQQLGGVYLGHIADELKTIGLIADLAHAIAIDLKSTSLPYERAVTLDTKVRRVHFGSPLQVDLELAQQVVGSVAAVSFLIYALKRAWGIDLELMTYREEMREQFIEAKMRADEAQERAKEAELEARKSLKASQAVYDQMSVEQGWGVGTARASGVNKFWDGGHAILRVEDED